MKDMTYLVYDGGDLLASFVSIAIAVDFVEGWRSNSDVAVNLVDANTGEVVDTWVNGKWENWG